MQAATFKNLALMVLFRGELDFSRRLTFVLQGRLPLHHIKQNVKICVGVQSQKNTKQSCFCNLLVLLSNLFT